MPEQPASRRAIEPEEARRYCTAAQTLATSTKMRSLEWFAHGALDAEPTTIYDLNGEPLFHDYGLADPFGNTGAIRAAAHTALGAPVVSMHGGALGWDPRRALRLATEQLHASSPHARVTDSRLVCYAYAKIGIELTYEDDGGAGTELFDASSGSVVSTSDDEEHQFTRYSLLGHVERDQEERLSRFATIAAGLGELPDPEPPTSGRRFRVVGGPLPMPAPTPIPIPIPIPIAVTRSGTVLQSPYCPSSPPGNSHYAQITDYFCVDASAQMLMEHYGWNYTQNTIATAMGTSAAQGGTTGAGLTSGFASLTHNQFDLTFDSGATRAQQFTDAVTELSANRPLFTQVPHHYRVCMGYSEQIRLGLLFDQLLYIYDPWPWNADLCSPGAPYWESWSSSPVMWFGIVHHA
jgi:hypothetical protein